MSEAILTSAKLRGSSPQSSRQCSRSWRPSSMMSTSPVDRPERASLVSISTSACTGTAMSGPLFVAWTALPPVVFLAHRRRSAGATRHPQRMVVRGCAPRSPPARPRTPLGSASHAPIGRYSRMSELAATGPSTVDRHHLIELIKRERSLYRANFPASWEAFSAAGQHLLGGVPMTWMRMWSGGYPLYFAAASGARLIDIDGNEFIDFCLG